MWEHNFFNKELNIKDYNVDCLYVNGCSFSEGAELHDSNNSRWSKLVADHYNIQEVNCAQGGGSNDRIFRTTTQDLLKMQGSKNPYVVLMFTNLSRFETGTSNGNWFPWSINSTELSEKDIKFASMYYENYQNDACDVERFAVQLFHLQNMLQSLNIPYLFLHGLNTPVETNKIESIASYLDLRYYVHQFDVRQYLMQWPNIKFGPGGHPLEIGQEKIKEWIINLTNDRYCFNRE